MRFLPRSATLWLELRVVDGKHGGMSRNVPRRAFIRFLLRVVGRTLGEDLGEDLECPVRGYLVRGYLVRDCPVMGVSGIVSLDSAVVSLHISLVAQFLGAVVVP